MTVATEVTRVTYQGNGTVGPYNIPYYFLEDDDLVVIKTLRAAPFTETTLVLNADYTLAGAGITTGGALTLTAAHGVLPATYDISIVRSPDSLQGLDLTPNDKFPADSLERALDKLAMRDQRFVDLLARAARLSDGDTSGIDVTLPTPVASAVLSVNAAKTAFQWVLQAGLLAVSAFGQTLLNAVNAAAARALLGITTLGSYILTTLTITTKGDIIVGTAADTVARKAVGTDGYALQAQSGSGDGLGYLPVAPFTLEGGYLDWTVAGNVLTVAIKTWAGADPSAADPVYVVFRNVTPATGSLVKRKVTAANSVSLNNTALAGTVNATAFRLWCTGHDDAGTVRLGLINCLSTVAGPGAGRDVTAIFPLAGWGIASSTLSDNAADNAQTFYTAVAVAAKAYATLGYATWEAGLAAAGTWSAVPTRIHLQRLGDPLPGQVIQTQRTDTGAMATGATTIPFDDTIPQNTEGDQYVSQAIVPGSAANALRVRARALFSQATGAAVNLMFSLYQDATANALATIDVVSSANDFEVFAEPEKIILAGLTVSTTFKLRVGGSSAGTNTFNGRGSARKFGGVKNSFIEAQEIMA